jgi:5'-3' exonuclease
MDENIRLVHDRMETIARSDELRRAYDQYEKAELDYISGIRAVEKKTRMEEDLKIAKIAILKGLSVDTIMELTGLNEETIKKLELK